MFHPTNWNSTWMLFKNSNFNHLLNWSTLLPFCLWNIWRNRNSNIFNNRSSPTFLKFAYSEAVEFFQLCSNSIPKKPITIHLSWIPPPRHYFKLNTDGSSLGNPGKEGIGGVIRNANGDWVLGFAQSFLHATNNWSFLALWKGLQLALQHNLTPIIINIDPEDIIIMLKSKNALFNSFIHECRLMLQRLGRPPVQHSYREQNKVVDALAKEGLQNFCIPSPFCSPHCLG